MLPRHQTLRATIEWSHDALTPEAARFFDSLGVFAASFTTERAKVAGIDTLEAAALIDELIAKSMLTPVPGTPPRFRMLETLRQFALERLEDAQRLGPVRGTHLVMADVCRTETPRVLGHDQLEALELLRLLQDDFRRRPVVDRLEHRASGCGAGPVLEPRGRPE